MSDVLNWMLKGSGGKLIWREEQTRNRVTTAHFQRESSTTGPFSSCQIPLHRESKLFFMRISLVPLLLDVYSS